MSTLNFMIVDKPVFNNRQNYYDFKTNVVINELQVVSISIGTDDKKMLVYCTYIIGAYMLYFNHWI